MKKIRGLVNIGISDLMDAEQKKSIRFSNKVSIFICVALLGSTIYQVLYDFPIYTIALSLCFAVLILTPLAFNAAGKHVFARAFFLLLRYTFIITISILFGPEYHFQYLLLVGMGIPMLMFNKETGSLKWILVAMIIPIWIYLEWHFQHFAPVFPNQIPIYPTRFIADFVVLLLIGIIFRSFAKESDKHISEVQEINDKLTRQNSFTETLLDNIPNMIFVKDGEELRFVRFNKAGEKLLGMDSAELLGKNDYDFFPKEQAEFFTNKDKEVFESQSVLDIEEEPIDTKNGQRFLHTTKVPIFDKNGKPEYLLGISEDITEKRQIRKDLELNESRLRSIFKNTLEGFATVDGEGKFTLINPAFQNMFGYSLEELQKLKVEDLMSKDNWKAHFKEFMKTQSIGSNVDLTGFTKDGQKFPLEIGLSHFEVDNVKYLTIVARDISFRKEKERELKERNRELKEANEDLEQFAYVATHDIKTPILNIDSFLNFLKGDKDIQQQRSKESIEWIDKSVKQAQKTIEDLVSVTKARKATDLELEEINLDKLLEEAQDNLQARIKESDAIIESHFEEAPIIRYEKIKAKSLMQNLLSNAIKYCASDRQPKIVLTTKRDGDFTCLSISDNGLGIDLERDYEKIFGLFKRAHSKIPGSGIGLYMTKKSVESLGGKIEVESEVGKGTTFKVYLKS